MREELVVDVCGSGIAAACCHLLLSGAGVSVRLSPIDRPRVPAILISPGTRDLFQDVFAQPGMFAGLPRIRRRVVAWGSPSAVTVPHEGLIVSEQELLERLDLPASQNKLPGPPGWTIYTAAPLPHPSTTLDFGNRTAVVSRVRLTAAADPEACLMESGQSGWLFLLPTGKETALLITAGSPAGELLDESRLIRSAIEDDVNPVGRFPANPRLADPLCGKDWLACGSAAVAFDPICGDGAGHALREALLACAIVRHTDPQTTNDELIREYRIRLWGGFRRHLALCLEFYSKGGNSEWWQAQCRLLRQGIDWIDSRPVPARVDRFRLNGLAMERV